MMLSLDSKYLSCFSMMDEYASIWLRSFTELQGSRPPAHFSVLSYDSGTLRRPCVHSHYTIPYRNTLTVISSLKRIPMFSYYLPSTKQWRSWQMCFYMIIYVRTVVWCTWLVTTVAPLINHIRCTCSNHVLPNLTYQISQSLTITI